MSSSEGILIVRADGVIDVPDAIATPAGLVAAVEQLLDKVLGPREQRQQQEQRET